MIMATVEKVNVVNRLSSILMVICTSIRWSLISEIWKAFLRCLNILRTRWAMKMGSTIFQCLMISGSH